MPIQKSRAVSKAPVTTPIGNWTKRTPRDLGYHTIAGRIDLNDSAKAISVPFDVRGLTRFSMQVILDSGSWATAVVELKWSIDGINFYSFAGGAVTKTGSPWTLENQDVQGYGFIGFDVTTPEGGAGEAKASFFGDSSQY